MADEAEAYDCTKDVQEHQSRVINVMTGAIMDLIYRMAHHDESKLQFPEKGIFDQFIPILKAVKFGSPEYEAARLGMGEGLKHHYQYNRHHPEHYENGIEGMNLLDVLEMVCDWMAAAEEHPDAELDLSFLMQRFQINTQLMTVIANTVQELKVYRTMRGAD